MVATDSEAIAACVEKAGGRAVMTRADHVSGSDRIFEALGSADPTGRCGIVVNVQGDLPTLAPADIRAALAPLADPAVDIATLAAEISRAEERTNPNVVKVVGTPVAPETTCCARSISPAPPRPPATARSIIISGSMRIRRAALARFVSLPPSPLEQREQLEQLRALEAGMRIDVDDRRQRAARRRHAGGSGTRARAAARRVDLPRLPVASTAAAMTSKRSCSRASRAPIRTSRSAKSIRMPRRCPAPTFEDASPRISRGEADLGMIPVENSVAGRVADIHHLMPASGLHIIAEHFMPVRHQLLGVKGATLNDIKTVESHVHALGQCRKVIRKLGIKPIVAADTAGSAREIAEAGDKTPRRDRLAARRRNLRPRHPRRGHRGRGPQHHALHRAVARSAMGQERRRAR